MDREVLSNLTTGTTAHMVAREKKIYLIFILKKACQLTRENTEKLKELTRAYIEKVSELTRGYGAKLSNDFIACLEMSWL